jgi:hypothetical protein
MSARGERAGFTGSWSNQTMIADGATVNAKSTKHSDFNHRFHR